MPLVSDLTDALTFVVGESPLGLGAFLVAIVGGYLLGSLPWGLVLTRLAGLGDVRTIGSGNIGATNVLRTGRKGLAALTLLLDGGKGALAVVLADVLVGPDARAFAGLAALVGHVFPVWLGFKGGKGVATLLGVLIALDPRVGLGAIGVWLIVAVLFRTSSLAALLATSAAPLVACGLGGSLAASGPALVGGLLVWARHGGNLRRLWQGTEPRIGHKATDPAP